MNKEASHIKPINALSEKARQEALDSLPGNGTDGQNTMAMEAEKTASPASTTQRYAYQITINNPLTYDCDHWTIKQKLIDNFPTLRYFCMADEIGENGTYHTLIPVCASAPYRNILNTATL